LIVLEGVHIESEAKSDNGCDDGDGNGDGDGNVDGDGNSDCDGNGDSDGVCTNSTWSSRLATNIKPSTHLHQWIGPSFPQLSMLNQTCDYCGCIASAPALRT
jgi:hypothetical protein